MATPDSQTEYWKSIPERIAALHRRIVESDGRDEQRLRGDTADLMQTLSNRLELALRRTGDRKHGNGSIAHRSPDERGESIAPSEARIDDADASR